MVTTIYPAPKIHPVILLTFSLLLKETLCVKSQVHKPFILSYCCFFHVKSLQIFNFLWYYSSPWLHFVLISSDTPRCYMVRLIVSHFQASRAETSWLLARLRESLHYSQSGTIRGSQQYWKKEEHWGISQAGEFRTLHTTMFYSIRTHKRQLSEESSIIVLSQM